MMRNCVDSVIHLHSQTDYLREARLLSGLLEDLNGAIFFLLFIQ